MNEWQGITAPASLSGVGAKGENYENSFNYYRSYWAGVCVGVIIHLPNIVVVELAHACYFRSDQDYFLASIWSQSFGRHIIQIIIHIKERLTPTAPVLHHSLKQSQSK